MKITYISLMVCICVVIAGCVLINKKIILNFFMANGDVFDASDLIIVFEGGHVNFAPTRERVDKAIEIYKQHPSDILVCAYPSYKGNIIKYLVRNGVRQNNISKTLFDYDGKKGGGTYNNILEIISVIKNNDKYNNIEIVTSPYHELRVSLILSTLIQEHDISELLKIKYSHINNSEALYTDTLRFIRIISHEVLGIAGFYVNHIVDKHFMHNYISDRSQGKVYYV